ncbi:MAG: S8 family serine peptidase [Gemmatimonas sp.]
MQFSSCTIAAALVIGSSSTLLAQAPKPDTTNIWPAREAVVSIDAKAKPIRIGIWDSGVDTTLFAGRLARDSKGKALIRGYDSFKKRQDTPMELVPAALLARQAELNAVTIGLDDMDTFVDSPAARAVQQREAAMTPEARKVAEEDVGHWTSYGHGTGVADAAMTNFDAAELVIARMEWWHGTPPVPCWNRDLANREAESIRDLLNFLVKSGARVVNMSWGRYEQSYVTNLKQCAPALSVDERLAIARYSVDTVRAVLRAGMMASPQVLFVGAAGNAGQTVAKANPATRLDLPNFVLVGAVNQQGNLPAFSNFGDDVTLFANGWRIKSRLPGGEVSYGTGTSMAAPIVTNTAAKMLAVNPALSGADLRRLLLQTADTNAKGLKLMHPAHAVDAARAARKTR